MVFAQDADTVGQDLLVQGDGLGKAARRTVCACEVVARGQGVGVVLTQDADTDAVGEDLLVQGDGLPEAARLPVCACEVVAGGQSVGVVLAQQLLENVHRVEERKGLERKTKVTGIRKSAM